jgi:hypothetical protein
MIKLHRSQTIPLVLLAGAWLLGCDSKEEAKPGAAASSGSAQSTAATAKATDTPAKAAGGSKCQEAAAQKAKLKDPSVDPSTLGSVEFDKMDCESGKLSAGWADCILGAKDYESAKKCQ